MAVISDEFLNTILCEWQNKKVITADQYRDIMSDFSFGRHVNNNCFITDWIIKLDISNNDLPKRLKSDKTFVNLLEQARETGNIIGL